MLQYNAVNIHWTGHAGFRIDYDTMIIYIDPYKLGSQYIRKNDADLIFITHNHFDHLSVADLKNISTKNTTIIAAQECVSKLKSLELKEIIGVEPNKKYSLHNVQIETTPAYNTNKDFHPMKDNKVGFILTIKNNRIYHTGDSDIIPEMKNVDVDVVLVPVSGTYVMTADEAAMAVNDSIRPKFAIPMHYGAIVGTKDDAVRFSKLVTVCEVKILEEE
jgi:L-ascorbate metabolism protein UlaG (beta-lactamase superfamily)